MTDKQLDELLRREMAPDEQPPELPKAAPRTPKRSPWMGLAAACLCFAVSAAVFLSMDFGAKGKDRAAPESAFDALYVESSKAEAGNGVGDLFCDAILDGVTEGWENKSTTSGSTAAPETEVPSTEPAALPEAPAEPSLPDDTVQESYGNLNLATLLDLSARYGENLNWDTFDPYFCEETAGEIYTMKFPVSSELYLLVAGDRDTAPEVIRLVLKADPDVFVDMRTGDVKEFLKKNNLD